MKLTIFTSLIELMSLTLMLMKTSSGTPIIKKKKQNQYQYQHQDILQEVSYRKQIARQRRTKFVEGISVTLKSTLRSLKVTGNGTIGQIIHDLLLDELLDVWTLNITVTLKMWVRGHSRSLKLVQFESLDAVSYSPSIVTMAVRHYSVKEWCDLENRVRVRSRSLEMAPFDRSHTSSYSPSTVTMAIFCIVCDLLVENREFFTPHLYLAHPQGVTPSEFREDV